jgi:pteridine reductase
MSEAGLALVTGAAHRLGRAFALALARRGFAVAVHYHRSRQAAEETALAIRQLGVPAYACTADLTDPAAVDSLFTFIDGLPHELGVLVNSAAVMRRADIREMGVPDWDAAFDLNLRAAFLCAQRAAKRMTGGGLIVNVTDVAADKAWHVYPAYSVSKSALEALTRVLARALAPAVRVNAIAPGLVLHSDVVSEEQWSRMVARLPLPRPATPEEIAGALIFLIENQYITGQTLVVDGGYSLL